MPNEGEWTKICAACAEGTPPECCAYYGEPNGCNAPKLGQHPDGNVAERLQGELEKAERRICVFLRDLARALDAAQKLGGADELRIGRDQLRLDGAGFTVVVCRALPDARAFRRFLVERGAEVDGAANTPRNGTEQLAGGVEK